MKRSGPTFLILTISPRLECSDCLQILLSLHNNMGCFIKYTGSCRLYLTLNDIQCEGYEITDEIRTGRRSLSWHTHCSSVPWVALMVHYPCRHPKDSSFWAWTQAVKLSLTPIRECTLPQPHSGVVPRHVGNDVDALHRRCGDMKQHVVHLSLERWRRACFYVLTVPAPPYVFGFHM